MESRDLIVQRRRARVWRGGSGPALLLLHAGGGDAHAGWHRVWDDLARDFSVAAPDWPGFGASEPMPKTTYTDLTNWIEDLRQALGFQKITIVGNSFGGTMARLYGAAFPEQVERLVLINGGGILASGGPMPPALFAILSSGKISGPDDIARAMLKVMFHDQAVLTPRLVAELVAGTDTIFAIMGQASAGPPPAQTTPSAPTLVLWGEGDRYVPPENGERVVAELPNAKLKLIAEAGHMPQIERPPAVVEAIREFLIS
jgi:pimeloyl-ACP methyl ester carboxylesterase